MFKFLHIGLLLLGTALGTSARAESVLFLNPGSTEEAFWISYSQFMQSAARNLGIDLQILYSQRQPELTLAQARIALQGPNRPDYLMFVNEQYIAPQILRLAQGSGVKLFMVNAVLTANQQALVGERADRIGSLVPNDEEGGYLMMKELIRLHPPVAKDQQIELLAFSGLKITPSAQLREHGMQRALAEHPQVRLRQLVYSGWTQQRAYEQARQLVKRYPEVSLVWSANDEMAFGAMRAFAEAGKTPGRDALFSAVNTSPAALQAVVDGRLSALVGGHFTLGGWALVELHDHELGVDLDQYGGRDRQIPLLQLVDKSHARQMLVMGKSPNYGVNFRQLSAKGRPASYRYPFNLQTLMH
ncbi:LacI family transcriptional regulator [Pseudomonas sp. MYb2]|jgi:ABC-type sugar transport system substrate-binding protein|uniref:ABC transporter substrate-binding protein n=1 Tax=unclassified Pseudomonas TaxID=196821 RepID=UPI000CFE68F0|nr:MULTISPECIES: ABC transporter substrate-binding protein [unclassified Pseudomonas]PRB44616.1 LacI family transcriptional regulator [Pseudomonas sp. MYb3]PRC30195.1 LacI family transcriptional regulator [Pseudomonas sp. MYb2]